MFLQQYPDNCDGVGPRGAAAERKMLCITSSTFAAYIGKSFSKGMKQERRCKSRNGTKLTCSYTDAVSRVARSFGASTP